MEIKELAMKIVGFKVMRIDKINFSTTDPWEEAIRDGVDVFIYYVDKVVERIRNGDKSAIAEAKRILTDPRNEFLTAEEVIKTIRDNLFDKNGELKKGVVVRAPKYFPIRDEGNKEERKLVFKRVEILRTDDYGNVVVKENISLYGSYGGDEVLFLNNLFEHYPPAKNKEFWNMLYDKIFELRKALKENKLIKHKTFKVYYAKGREGKVVLEVISSGNE
jgi:hypothetical protein